MIAVLNASTGTTLVYDDRSNNHCVPLKLVSVTILQSLSVSSAKTPPIIAIIPIHIRAAVFFMPIVANKMLFFCRLYLEREAYDIFA